MKINGIILLCIALSLTLTLSGCTSDVVNTSDVKLKNFSSAAEIDKFIDYTQQSSVYYAKRPKTTRIELPNRASSESIIELSDLVYGPIHENFSIIGVDEADIVKNDGYIYYLSNSTIYILSSQNGMNILSMIRYNHSHPREMYINGDRLIVVGNEGFEKSSENYSSNAFVKIYDVSDRARPRRLESISLEGDYFYSRMIGDYAYVIVDEGIYEHFSSPTIHYGNGLTKDIKANEISYFDVPHPSYDLITFISVNIRNSSFSYKTILNGYSLNTFASHDELCLVNQKFVPSYLEEKKAVEEAAMKYLPDEVKQKIETVYSYDLHEDTKMTEVQSIIQNYTQTLSANKQADIKKRIEESRKRTEKERDNTIMDCFSLKDGKVEFRAHGEVPGTVLDQFSIDEYNGYLRIATTTGKFVENNILKNNIYVLDQNLSIVGKIENLAPGESIYSARFIENRAYINTNGTFLAIDLKVPEKPKILGESKISGFSNHLLLYDENHLIGIGKDAGVKISLFDVAVEKSRVIIGDRGTYSNALYDPKSLLFSKDLLVLPVEFPHKTYVYGVDQGFTLKGILNGSVRSVRIGNVLYTMSETDIVARNLSDMSVIGTRKLGMS